MIRLATVDDIEAVLRLGRQMHAEGAFRSVALDEDKVRDMIGRCIAHGFACVNEGREGVDGLLLGHVAEFWYSRATCASDLAFYVRPDRRGSIAAVRLIQAFVAWGRDAGAAKVVIAQSSGVRVEEATHLLTGMGFAYRGGVFEWEIL